MREVGRYGRTFRLPSGGVCCVFRAIIPTWQVSFFQEEVLRRIGKSQYDCRPQTGLTQIEEPRSRGLPCDPLTRTARTGRYDMNVRSWTFITQFLLQLRPTRFARSHPILERRDKFLLRLHLTVRRARSDAESRWRSEGCCLSNRSGEGRAGDGLGSINERTKATCRCE